MVNLKCLRCGAEFCKGTNKNGIAKRFCSISCRIRYNSYNQYLKLKDNPEYKKEKYMNLKLWIENNREHFNDLCRERSRIHQSKTRAERIAKKLCTICATPLDNNKRCCSKCAKKKYEVAKIRLNKIDKIKEIIDNPEIATANGTLINKKMLKDRILKLK